MGRLWLGLWLAGCAGDFPPIPADADAVVSLADAAAPDGGCDPIVERCNGLDDDCDGALDEGGACEDWACIDRCGERVAIFDTACQEQGGEEWWCSSAAEEWWLGCLAECPDIPDCGERCVVDGYAADAGCIRGGGDQRTCEALMAVVIDQCVARCDACPDQDADGTCDYMGSLRNPAGWNNV